MFKIVDKEEWEIDQKLIATYKDMVSGQADYIKTLKQIDEVNEILIKNQAEQIELLKDRVKFLEEYNSVLKEQLESYAEDEAGASR